MKKKKVSSLQTLGWALSVSSSNRLSETLKGSYRHILIDSLFIFIFNYLITQMLITEGTASKYRLVLIGVNPGHLVHSPWRYNGAILPSVGYFENLILEHTTLVKQILPLNAYLI